VIARAFSPSEEGCGPNQLAMRFQLALFCRAIAAERQGGLALARSHRTTTEALAETDTISAPVDQFLSVFTCLLQASVLPWVDSARS
jgi:hypothetical protein